MLLDAAMSPLKVNKPLQLTGIGAPIFYCLLHRWHLVPDNIVVGHRHPPQHGCKTLASRSSMSTRATFFCGLLWRDFLSQLTAFPYAWENLWWSCSVVWLNWCGDIFQLLMKFTHSILCTLGLRFLFLSDFNLDFFCCSTFVFLIASLSSGNFLMRYIRVRSIPVFCVISCPVCKNQMTNMVYNYEDIFRMMIITMMAYFKLKLRCQLLI